MAKLTEEERARRALDRRRKAALLAEADEIRREAKWREWDEKNMRLTWAEYEAGVACRGCGLPTRPLKMDRKQREDPDAAQADFRKRHPDCRSHVWGGPRWETMHCGLCCPPLPLRQEQIDRLAAIVVQIESRGTSELATWQLTLTCDHVVEWAQHRDHDYVLADAVKCSQCQQIRGIVTTARIPQAVSDNAETHRRASEIAKARSEHERLQKKADAARRRMTKLERQFDALDKER